MTTEVIVKVAGHPVQTRVLDRMENNLDGTEVWRVAHTYITMPGEEPLHRIYATTTRRIEVVDLEPDAAQLPLPLEA